MADEAPAEMLNQSGVIPFRVEDGQLQIALITSRDHRRWVIPGGGIDDGETPAEAAERETLEEAGLIGPLSEEPIGTYTTQTRRGPRTIQVFLMHVMHAAETWPEAKERTREWVTYDEAVRHVHQDELKDMICSLHDLLTQDGASESD